MLHCLPAKACKDYLTLKHQGPYLHTEPIAIWTFKMHVHVPLSFINQKKGIWNACFFPRYNFNMSTTEYIEHGITVLAISDLGNTPCLFILMLAGMSYINQPIKVLHPRVIWRMPNLPCWKLLYTCTDFLYHHFLSEITELYLHLPMCTHVSVLWVEISMCACYHALKSAWLCFINVTFCNSALSRGCSGYGEWQEGYGLLMTGF